MRKNEATNQAEPSGGRLSDKSRRTLTRAFDQANSAMDLLDSVDAPADIGAHLQMAVNRLREVLNPQI